jgi:hypothetical protein
MKNDNQYYFAILGPVSRKKLDKKYPHGEGALRHAIQSKFFEMFNTQDFSCSSGWGVTADAKDGMSFETHDDELKKVVIESYYQEKKKLPRYARAWELLFKEENEKNKK